MRTIYHYGVAPSETVTINLAANAKPIHFDLRDGYPTVWVEQPSTLHHDQAWEFTVVGTGWNFEDIGHHAGTLIEDDGFVWHLYAKPPDGDRISVTTSGVTP